MINLHLCDACGYYYNHAETQICDECQAGQKVRKHIAESARAVLDIDDYIVNQPEGEKKYEFI